MDQNDEEGALAAHGPVRIKGAFSSHWSPHDRVGAVHAVSSYGLSFPGVGSLGPGPLAFNTRPYDAFQLRLTPFNSARPDVASRRTPPS
jgi:hypothetical protein